MMNLRVGGRLIPCQDESPFKIGKADYTYLPVLLKLTSAIELATGYGWKVTSFVRQSPSHQFGVSLDIAPDLSASSFPSYSVAYGSDPVLYKRETLIRALQEVAARWVYPENDLGIFIEPDHLHLQIFANGGASGTIRVIKWKQVKNCYRDSSERINLPLMK